MRLAALFTSVGCVLARDCVQSGVAPKRVLRVKGIKVLEVNDWCRHVMCGQLSELLSHGWHVHLDDNDMLYGLLGYAPPDPALFAPQEKVRTFPFFCCSCLPFVRAAPGHPCIPLPPIGCGCAAWRRSSPEREAEGQGEGVPTRRMILHLVLFPCRCCCCCGSKSALVVSPRSVVVFLWPPRRWTACVLCSGLYPALSSPCVLISRIPETSISALRCAAGPCTC